VERLVLIALMMRTNASGCCFVSFGRIARDIAATERAVIKAVKRLINDGLIAVVTGADRQAVLQQAKASPAVRANVYRVVRETADPEHSSHSDDAATMNSTPPEGEFHDTARVNSTPGREHSKGNNNKNEGRESAAQRRSPRPPNRLRRRKAPCWHRTGSPAPRPWPISSG
jgi:hypothetical protein